MTTSLRTSALLLAFAGCAPTAPTDTPDASVPGVPRIDVSEWRGVVSDQAATLLEQLGRAWAGQSADLNGDGRVDLLALRSADGSLTYRYEPSANGRPLWILEQLPDGHERLSMDLDERTFWGVVIDDFPDGHRVVMKDRTFNNKYDFRSTWTRTAANDGYEIVEEEDPTETGAWTETRRFLMNDVNSQGTKCNGFRNWVVAPEQATTKNIGETTIGFASVPAGPHDDSKSLACTKPHRDKLMRVFACALDRLGCLDLANREFAILAWATATKRKILVGCGNDCAGSIAATNHIKDEAARSRMAWNPAELDRLSDQDLCSTRSTSCCTGPASRPTRQTTTTAATRSTPAATTAAAARTKARCSPRAPPWRTAWCAPAPRRSACGAAGSRSSRTSPAPPTTSATAASA